MYMFCAEHGGCIHLWVRPILRFPTGRYLNLKNVNNLHSTTVGVATCLRDSMKYSSNTDENFKHRSYQYYSKGLTTREIWSVLFMTIYDVMPLWKIRLMLDFRSHGGEYQSDSLVGYNDEVGTASVIRSLYPTNLSWWQYHLPATVYPFVCTYIWSIPTSKLVLFVVWKKVSERYVGMIFSIDVIYLW